MKRTALWTLLGLALALPCSGCEITTHALITLNAFDASVLNPSGPKTIATALGFDRLGQDYPFSLTGDPSGSDYRDEAVRANPADAVPVYTDNYLRRVQDQQRIVLQTLVSHDYLPGTSGAAVEQSVRSWLLRGAIRGDDNDGYALGNGVRTTSATTTRSGPLLARRSIFCDPL